MKRWIKLVFLAAFVVAVSIIASCAVKEEKFHDELKHPTRAHEIGAEEVCYVGETVRTDKHTIRFIASGTYYGSDPSKQKSEDTKYIYMEFEYRSLNETDQEVGIDNFSLMTESGDQTVLSASSMDNTIKVNRKKVFFQVPKSMNNAEIIFMETEEDLQRYLFLWEGSYSAEALK